MSNDIIGNILVCAPSNAAVDELALRVLENGLLGTDGVTYFPKIVRLGQLESIHPKVQKISLDSLFQKAIENESSTYFETKMKLQEIRKKRKDFVKILSDISNEIKVLTNQIEKLRESTKEDNDDIKKKSSRLNQLFKSQQEYQYKMKQLEPLEKDLVSILIL